MIIDSSALIAIAFRENGAAEMRAAILAASRLTIPAPVVTEVHLVMGGRGAYTMSEVDTFFAQFLTAGATIVPFDESHTAITASASQAYGKGNGSGGKLNFGDLMVYAVAKTSGYPLLCTGNDFADTDLVLHPASRLDP